MNSCPRCRTVLDGGPVVYRCPCCERAVYAADLDVEYHPRTLATVRPALKAWP